MIKSLPISRKQRRSIKKKLLGVMCASMIISNNGMYCLAVSYNNSQNQEIVQEVGSVNTVSRAGEIQEEHTTIDISTLEIVDGKRTCNINKDGAYLLTGSNYDADKDVYIPTNVYVESGVKATIYLKDFSIDNRDGILGECGMEGDTKPLENHGEINLVLLSDAVFSRAESAGGYTVENNGTINLEESEYTLSVLCDEIEGKAFYGGRLNVKGSTLVLSNTLPDYLKLTMYGGRILCSTYIKEMYYGAIQVDGGCWNYELVNPEQECSYISSQGKGLVMATVSGMPINQKITLIQQNDSDNSYSWNYNAAGVVTDASGEVMIACLEGADKLLLKCNNTIYEAVYNMDSGKWVATETLNTQIYQITYQDIDTGEVLLKGTASKYGYSKIIEDTAKYTYKYYQTTDTTGAAYDFNSISSDSIVYVKRILNQYNVTVKGDTNLNTSYTLDYGEKFPNAEEYVFIVNGTTDKYWDGTVTGDVSVTAYNGITVDNTKYMKIDDLAGLNCFADLVNNGKNSLNGYLTADIAAGDFKGIGTDLYCYKGTFNGNHHTVNLAINETSTYVTGDARSLFRYIDNATILKVNTTGTITTTRPYAGGIVGFCRGYDGCLIKQCSSNVTITYMPGGEGYVGGILGGTDSNYAKIYSCWFYGSLKSGNINVPLTKQGGISGKDGLALVCYVDSTFETGSSGETFCMDGNSNSNYYISPCGTSTQGEKVTKEAANTPEFAYQLNKSYWYAKECWSYTKESGLCLADSTHLPICQVEFIDEGEYEWKKLDTITALSTGEDGKVALPDAELMNNFLEEGHKAKWYIAGDEKNELTADTVITSDSWVSLKIDDNKEYNVTGSDIENSTIIFNEGKTEIQLANIPVSGTYFKVQNSERTFTQELTSQSSVISAGEIIVNGKALTNFENCGVRIETTKDSITYAKKASDGKGYEVNITAGSNMTKTIDSGELIQSDKFSNISSIIFTANEGYCFPEDYVSKITELTNGALNGITVTRDNDSQITLSGAPTNNTSITLPNADLKTYTIVTSLSEKNFADKNVGYSILEDNKQEITITNTGNQAVNLSANTLTNYELLDFSNEPLAPNKTATFRVCPKVGLSAGTYNETLKVSTENETSTSINLSFKVNNALGLTVNPITTTIIDGESSKLTANPVGGSGNYTYKWYIDGDAKVIGTGKDIVVSPSKTTTYKVVVNDTIENKEVTSTITVNPKTYTITSSITSNDFGIKNEGYIAPAAKTITITNKGNQTVTLGKVTSTNYIVGNFSKSTLAPNETATFTVQPKAGLSTGSYSEAIEVKTTNETSVKVNVSFKVNKALKITVSPVSSTIIDGESSKLTANPVGGSGKYTYKWNIDGEAKVIGTGKDIVVSPSKTTTYKVVINDTVESKEITSTITVNPKTYTITATKINNDFGSKSESYTSSPAKTVTIKNTGNQAITLGKVTSTNYIVGNFSKTTLAPNETATFTVQPKAGLSAGIYNEKLVIKTTKGTSVTVNVNFKVNKIAAPTSVKAVATSYNKIKVNWNKLSYITGYEIYQYNSKTYKYEKVAVTKGSYYTINNLKTGSTYKYRVRAYRTVNGKTYYGNFSNQISAKPVLKSVTSLKVSNYISKTASLRWSKVYGASGYKIYKSTNEDSGFKLLTSIKDGDTVKYSNKYLRKGKTFYYKVRAYRTVNGRNVYSNYSTTIKVTIK